MGAWHLPWGFVVSLATVCDVAGARRGKAKRKPTWPRLTHVGLHVGDCTSRGRDEAVSNLTQALDRKAMLDNTLIVFSADNGGVYHGGQLGNNYPLRGQKTSSWEGGVRATAFVWGGKATAFPEHVRGTETDVFVHICDWYATLATLVGVDPTDSKHAGEGVPAIDSVDQWDVLMRANTTFSDSVRQTIKPSTCEPKRATFLIRVAFALLCFAPRPRPMGWHVGARWVRPSKQMKPVWPPLNKGGTVILQQVRKEVPLAFCPDTPASKGIRGPDNCCT